jgi:uncharacterized protein YgbK (DUF1537 family)
LGLKKALSKTEDCWVRLSSGASSGSLYFKKVDSVLRGHPLEETLLVMRLGGFRRCVFAPAFPEMGRITRNGQHLVRSATGQWEPALHSDLRSGFAALGIEVGDDAVRGEASVVVLDAETQNDLATAVAAIPCKDGILWAGSRGLAEVLAPRFAPLPWPRVSLFVIGTTHPSTRAQVDALQNCTEAFPTTGPVRIEGGVSLILDPVPEAADAAATRLAILQAVSRVQEPLSECTICVVGGDTLSTLLDASSATGLDCIGEVAPGLPCSRIRGGHLNGVNAITKSGGFGGPELLRQLLDLRR